MGGNLHDGVAQWIERQFAELNVAGSTPVTVAFSFLVRAHDQATFCMMDNLLCYLLPQFETHLNTTKA